MPNTDTILADYIECALWSSSHYASEDAEPIPFDEVDAELSPEAIESMREDIDGLLSLTEDIDHDWTDEQLGHDFWLTRNGHGAGFWDRGKGAVGDALSDAARTFGTSDLYLGDDGLIYVA